MPAGLSRSRLYGIGVAAAVVFIVANSAATIFSDYQETVENHKAMVHDLAAVAADQTYRTIHNTDIALRQIVAVVHDSGGLAAMRERANWEKINRIAEPVVSRTAIVVLDKDGTVVANSEAFPAPPASYAESRAIKVLAASDVLYIEPAFQSKAKPGVMIFGISRRLSDDKGRFLGIVAAGISMSYLTEFYNLMSFRKDPSIAVFTQSGDLIARRPFQQTLLGANVANGRLFRDLVPRASEGIFRAVTPLDGIERLTAYRVDKNYGFVVVSGIRWEMVVSEWRQRSLRTGAIALGAVLFILAGNGLGLRLQRRAQSAQRELGEAQLALQEARRDSLTGLPSRALFLEMAEAIRLRCAGQGLRMAVMIVDLDNFKGVNDSHGHQKGDEVLVRAAEVLRAALRESDVAGRLGGDEFGVCVSAPADLLDERAAKIGARIVERMEKIGLGIGCSVGMALCASHCKELDCALRKADEAMYEAKRRGKSGVVAWGEASDQDWAWKTIHPSCQCGPVFGHRAQTIRLA
jgi:diguanylate cyclase (GGDEF)-like protein